jgi:quercetin dioxygenase-like cupin family protein
MATALLSFGNTLPHPQSDRSLWYMGGLMTIHADSQDTNGQFALIEVSGAPGGEPPLHVHKHEDELFYVLEGKLKVYRGDEELILEPGNSGFLPRNVPHTFKVMSSHVRMLNYITPGGFEGYFREMGEPATGFTAPKSKTPPALTRIVSVAKRYGISFHV